VSGTDVIAQTIQMISTGQSLQPVAFEAVGAIGIVSLQLVCGCFLPLLFLAIALIAGSFVEQAHLRRLAEAEAAHADIIRTDTRAIPPQLASAEGASGANGLQSELVLSSVVLSIDHFRNFLTLLRKIIGGELGLYGRLAMRARREALVRLLAEARARGAVAVINIRFETSNINGVMQPQKNKGTMVEVLAYGTALRMRGPATVVHAGSPRPTSPPPPPPGPPPVAPA